LGAFSGCRSKSSPCHAAGCALRWLLASPPRCGRQPRQGCGLSDSIRSAAPSKQDPHCAGISPLTLNQFAFNSFIMQF
jgi:hypothetical protein